MEMVYYQLARSSYQDSFKLLEADLHHANALAAEIPANKGGVRLQMKLVYNQFAPLYLFLLQWIDSSCTCLLPMYLDFFHIVVYKVYSDGKQRVSSSTNGRKATIKDFYAVILPSLCRLHDHSWGGEDGKGKLPGLQFSKKSGIGKDSKLSDLELERDDECGICLEPCAKMVLPGCCHAMCIKCYRNWNLKSESCPFCRGSLKRINSEDLWVLTCNGDVVDTETVRREDLSCFYLYINNLPKDHRNAVFSVNYEYLF